MVAALEIFTATDVLEKGLLLSRVDQKRLKHWNHPHKIRKFRNQYGAHPAVIAQIWEDLQITDISMAKIDHSMCSFSDFMIAINFLKIYPTEDQQAMNYGKSKNNIRKWRWFFVYKLHYLRPQVVFWPKEWVDDANETEDAGNGVTKKSLRKLLISVDGVHFHTREYQHPVYSKNTKLYSHKFRTAGLSYEIGIDLNESRVVHVNGPFPAGHTDKVIFKKGLYDKIPKGCCAIGDKGYIDQSVAEKLSTPNAHDNEETRKFKGRARARHESFNKMLKRWAIMTHRFVHENDKHVACFDAVLVLCQYQMNMGEPLFDL